MTDVRFYHLTETKLEQALPELLDKTLERGWKAVVKTGSAERAEALTHQLWTFRPEVFLPHGNAKDGHASLQPIWLTEKEERPNAADVLFLTDGAETSEPAQYERICELFDGNDEAAVLAARERWKKYKALGFELSYWQQDEKGWSNAGG